MSCVPIQYGYICGVASRYQRRRLKCQGQCGKPTARVVFSYGSPYYAPTAHCVECGDTWSDGQLGERPFARAWRVKAIRRHTAMWDAGCACKVDSDEELYPLPCSKHKPRAVVGGNPQTPAGGTE